MAHSTYLAIRLSIQFANRRTFLRSEGQSVVIEARQSFPIKDIVMVLAKRLLQWICTAQECTNKLGIPVSSDQKNIDMPKNTAVFKLVISPTN